MIFITFFAAIEDTLVKVEEYMHADQLTKDRYVKEVRIACACICIKKLFF